MQIWICEAMPKLGELIGKKIPGNHIPRRFSWSLKDNQKGLSNKQISKVMEDAEVFVWSISLRKIL